MSTPQIAALTAVSADLIQALGASGAYRGAAQELMSLAVDFDVQLSQLAVNVPREGIRSDHFIDFARLDFEEARKGFLAIRRKMGEMGERFPLLLPSWQLIDHISHHSTNVLSFMGIPGPVAFTSSKGILLNYPHVDKPAYQWSLAVYLGLSPFPLFGEHLDYEAQPVIRYLSRFGFGVFVFLYLAVHPQIAAEGRLPSKIIYRDQRRPVAPADVHFLADGSIVLGKPTEEGPTTR